MANLWINNYSDKLISKERTGSNGRCFKSILFNCSAIGGTLASVTVSPKQIRQSTRRNGEPINGFSCILLGAPDTERVVTFRNGDTFEKITMTIQEIYDSIEQNRADWKAKQQSETSQELPQETPKKGGRKATKALKMN